jgi:soluble lytic murein transglycosylase-like protein
MRMFERDVEKTPARLILLCCLGLFLIIQNSLCAEAQNNSSTKTAAARARRFEPFILSSAKRHGVDPRLLWTIAWLETRFEPNRVSHAGARGLMQFMPATASRYGLANPHDPVAAIDAAARYLRDLAARFPNRADLVLAAYNAGEGAVEAYLTGRTIKAGDKIINPKGLVTGGVPPYRETRAYVARGLRLLSKTTFAFAEGRESPTDEEPGHRPGVVRKSIRY